jgi:hypothetical protein
MTNAADRNEVISFRRAADGSLQEGHRFATGGRGSGGNNDPLESQGSLTLSQDHTLLFAVNAGSGEISVFQASSVCHEESILCKESVTVVVSCVPQSSSSPSHTTRQATVLFHAGSKNL